MVKRTNRIQKLAMEAILALIATGILPVTGARGENKSEGWKTYHDKELKFELKYPAKLIQISKEGQRLKLLHSIPFEHSNPCDFDDTPDPPFKELTDFNVTLEILDKNLKGAVLWYEASAAEYFLTRFTSDSVLQLEPGHIDTVRAGLLKGYRIFQGAEGCGRFNYYFVLDAANTLAVTRKHITELDPVIESYKENRKLPGVIVPEREEELFNSILSTFKFRK
jgi:hypothetical protein